MTTMATPEIPPVDVQTRHSARKARLFGLVIFLCGMIAGSGLTMFGIQSYWHHKMKNPRDIYMGVFYRIETKLTLTPEQREKAITVFDTKSREFEGIFDSIHKLTSTHFDVLRDEVAAVLDPAQADTWKSEFDALRQNYGPPFGPPERPDNKGPHGPDALPPPRP